MRRLIETISPLIGADPEFFFSKRGKIVESNKIIPKDGLIEDYDYFNGIDLTKLSKCTVDGVQAELNPRARTCRQGCAREYISLFKKLQQVMTDKKIDFCSKSVIHLSDKELLKLSEESRVFGCEPSINNYTNKESEISVNPNIYGLRSAGGHIHIGARDFSDLKECINTHHRMLVKILDLVLGNTCVMIDRDPNQKERRKVYGKAGEYRLPEHGLEYRTLSNFWLRSYQTMSMIYGFTRLAVSIGYNIWYEENYCSWHRKKYPNSNNIPKDVDRSDFRDFLENVNEDDVKQAINENDFDLAKENWDKIKYDLVDMVGDRFGVFPISRDTLGAFEHFIEKGLDYWFKEDIIKHWTSLNNAYGFGWESFLKDVVKEHLRYNGFVTWRYKMFGNGFEVIPKAPLSSLFNEFEFKA